MSKLDSIPQELVSFPDFYPPKEPPRFIKALHFLKQILHMHREYEILIDDEPRALSLAIEANQLLGMCKELHGSKQLTRLCNQSQNHKDLKDRLEFIIPVLEALLYLIDTFHEEEDAEGDVIVDRQGFVNATNSLKNDNEHDAAKLDKVKNTVKAYYILFVDKLARMDNLPEDYAEKLEAYVNDEKNSFDIGPDGKTKILYEKKELLSSVAQIKKLEKNASALKGLGSEIFNTNEYPISVRKILEALSEELDIDTMGASIVNAHPNEE